MSALSPAALSDARILAAYVIFLASYSVFALGKFPGLKIDRTGAAIIGAVGMVAFRAVRPGEALHFIDFSTIVLLFSMMLIVGNLHLVGVFEWNAEAVLRRLKPHQLLPAVVFTCGFLSGFFVNDIVCLGDGAVRVEHHAADAAGTASLPAGGGYGVESWERVDDYGQSAEHAHRIVLGDSVSRLSGAPGCRWRWLGFLWTGACCIGSICGRWMFTSKSRRRYPCLRLMFRASPSRCLW
jgi:hypothetical protein